MGQNSDWLNTCANETPARDYFFFNLCKVLAMLKLKLLERKTKIHGLPVKSFIQPIQNG